MQETQVQSLGWEDPLKEGMATHSSIHARKISWTEEPVLTEEATGHGVTKTKVTECTHARTHTTFF